MTTALTYFRFERERSRRIQDEYVTPLEFCQCRIESHKTLFDHRDNPDLKHPHSDTEHCDVSCFYHMSSVSRACEYENSLNGVMFYRGSKVHYDTEMCSFWRMRDKKELKFVMKNLLLFAEFFIARNSESSSTSKSMLAYDPASILTTIMILALIQHYSIDLNDKLNEDNQTRRPYVATQMLDCTRSLRVAASFAKMGHGTEYWDTKNNVQKKRQGVVRHLLVDSPTAIDIEKSSNEYWNKLDDLNVQVKRLGVYVRRLGDSEMLLVNLAPILPPSSVRPLNQAGYLIVSETDLIFFHKLRLQVEKKWDPDRKIERIPELIEILRNDKNLNDELDEYVTAAKAWDALLWSALDVRISETVEEIDLGIPALMKDAVVSEEDRDRELAARISDEVQIDEFFHKDNGIGNPFPKLSYAQLYPIKDPMKNVMISMASSIEDKMVENGGWW